MLRYHKYILLSNSSGRSIEAEHAPIGWSDNKISLLRDDLYYGVFKTILFDYTFTKEMYDFLLEEMRIYEYDLDIILRVYNREEWQFDGKIDLDPFEVDYETREFKVDIIRSTFMENFQNRDEMDFNVFNDESVDGVSITPAQTKVVKMRPKILQYRTRYGLTAIQEILNQTKYIHTLPVEVLQNNNPNAFGVNATYLSGAFADFFTSSNSFYHNQSVVSQTPSFVFNLDVTTVFKGINGNYSGENPYMQKYSFLLVEYDEGGNFVTTHHQIGPYHRWYGRITNNKALTITVDPGHYLIFYVSRSTNNNIVLTQTLIDAAYETEFNYDVCSLSIDEPSTFPETTCHLVPPFELFQNLLAQMTGCENLVSNIFGRKELGYDQDGEAAYDMITNGYFIRLFKNKLQDPENGRELATNFRDAFKSYNTRYNLGLKIIGNTVYIDKKSDLLDMNVVVNLGEVGARKRMPNENVLFNHVKIGYENILTEEINGADEFNTTSTYTNSLKSYKETLDLVSPFNAAGYAIEKARRRNIEQIGDEDTRYDEKIFRIQCTFVDGELVNERDERFGLIGNIVSPETAMNVNLTPARMMKEWARYLSIPVRDKIYKYQSKQKNSKLISDYQGTTTYELSQNNIVTDGDNGTFEGVETTWGDFNEKSTSSLSGRSSNQARTGTYSVGFIPDGGNTFGVQISEGIFQVGIYGLKMASWRINLKAGNRYVLTGYINIISKSSTSQDDALFSIKPDGFGADTITWATETVGWQKIECIFISPYTGSITFNLLASWGAPKTPNRVHDIEAYFDDLTCEEYTPVFTGTGGGLSEEGTNIDVGENRYHLPYINVFNFPVTRDTLDALEANPLGLIQYQYQGYEYFEFLHEIEAEVEKRGAKWKTLPITENPIVQDGVKPEFLPILKHDSGDEDYMKHDSGDEDYLLYDEK